LKEQLKEKDAEIAELKERVDTLEEANKYNVGRLKEKDTKFEEMLNRLDDDNEKNCLSYTSKLKEKDAEIKQSKENFDKLKRTIIYSFNTMQRI